MNKDIFLTNNLSNKKEKFVPIDEKNIGMYVCGPTVYDDPHIGNARPIVIFDILFKFQVLFQSPKLHFYYNQLLEIYQHRHHHILYKIKHQNPLLYYLYQRQSLCLLQLLGKG